MKKFIFRFIAVLVFCFSVSAAHAFEARVVVSSFKPDILATYVPGNLMDNDTTTAWTSLGDGQDESVTVRFSQPVRVVKLGLFNGEQGTGKFDQHNRIAKGRILYPEGDEIPFSLKDAEGEQVIACDSGSPVGEFVLVVDEVTPKGKKYEFRGVAISEIKLYLANIPPTKEEQEARQKAEEERRLLDESGQVIRSFLVLNTRLDEDALLLYPKTIRKKERMNLYLFQEYQKQLGTYERLRNAKVDASAITFEKVSHIAPDATVYAKGTMVVHAGNQTVSVPVDSDFILRRIDDEWKIVREKPRSELKFEGKAITKPE